MAKFSDRLNEALSRRGMRPSDLAKATGIGEGAISQYRKGAYKATQINLEKMAHTLNVPIPWLMGVDDNITISPKNEKPTVGEDDGLSDEKREAINAIYEALKNLSLEDLQAIGQVVAAISNRVSPEQPRD
jgi:transcriptional regulator with XRE-family HTH domain